MAHAQAEDRGGSPSDRRTRAPFVLGWALLVSGALGGCGSARPPALTTLDSGLGGDTDEGGVAMDRSSETDGASASIDVAAADARRRAFTDASTTGMDVAGCGQTGYPCCAGGACNSGGECVAGYCASTASVGGGAPRGPDGAVGCGNMGFVCCSDDACNADLRCVSGYCAQVRGGERDGGMMGGADVSVPGCGMMGYPCCVGGVCGPGYVCVMGYCAMGAPAGECGMTDRLCCIGGACELGLTCVGGYCRR